MPPPWVSALADFYVPLSILSALIVLGDIFVLGHRQPMAIMNAVWPLTMLYWGPLGFLFYFGFGQAPSKEPVGRDRHDPSMAQATFNGASHCGAGCALGDFIGDWIAFATGFALAGSALMGKYVLAFVFAYLFGIVFQYYSVAPMRGLNLRDGLIAAVKIDTLSLLAYEIGMFAFMGLRAWAYPSLEPTTWSYWLFMQIAMICGLATTYPVNWWLIRKGVKEKM
jgi:hypothetical protein